MNEPAKISPVLQRLIEEVRRERAEGTGPGASNSYDRAYNRHYRSGGTSQPQPTSPEPAPPDEPAEQG